MSLLTICHLSLITVGKLEEGAKIIIKIKLSVIVLGRKTFVNEGKSFYVV